MYKHKHICTTILLLFAFAVAVANTQKSWTDDDLKTDAITTPKLLNYQGKLTTLAGTPVTDSTYSINFKLFNTLTGGTAFWNETQNITTSQGIFNVLLGSNSPIDTIPQSGNCYLEMQVNPNPAMTPRIRLVSSAYAYLSKKADTANFAPMIRPISPGIGTTEIVDGAVTNVKLAANAVTSDKIQDGTIQLADLAFTPATRPLSPGVATSEIADGAVTMPKINQSGATAGQVLKWTGSAWAPRADSAGGLPSGTAGGDLTGTYPNPAIATNAVNSAKILDNSIRGIDIAKPCTLTASSSVPILNITNSGTGSSMKVTRNATGATNPAIDITNTGSGAGIYSVATTNDIGTAGIIGNHTSGRAAVFGYTGTTFPGVPEIAAGLASHSNTGFGLYVNYSGINGIMIDSTNPSYTGAYIRKAGWNGYAVDDAGGNGVWVGNTGYNGYYLFGTANLNGLYINNANRNGVYLNNVGHHGLYLNHADTNGIFIRNTGRHGIYIDSVYQFGVNIRKANQDGVWVQNAGSDGFYASQTGSDGLHIETAGDDGIQIDSCNWYGLWALGCRSGVVINRAANYGLLVSNAGQYGIYTNSNSQRGGYIRNNNNDYYALTAWNNTGTGASVKGLYVQGNGYATGGFASKMGDKSGFATISPNVEVILSGSGSLADGISIINFDQSTREAISENISLKVIITPTSECNGVFVSNKSVSGFTVKELAGGRSEATFDWIAIGRIKGYEQTPEIEPIIREPELTDLKEYAQTKTDNVIEPYSSRSHEDALQLINLDKSTGAKR
ncbi:MAG: hypothetical protein KGZ86_05580 [Candidatus Latescibacteria bacterium]|nr:hypothetical protein [Candidatus Latescibacterota bacterium]